MRVRKDYWRYGTTQKRAKIRDVGLHTLNIAAVPIPRAHSPRGRRATQRFAKTEKRKTKVNFVNAAKKERKKRKRG